MTRSFRRATPGLPGEEKNCCDIGVCTREELKIPRGQRYELCRSVHAEANAIIAAARDAMIGASLYLVGKECSRPANSFHDANSCSMCKRFIINAGIKRIVIRNTKQYYTEINVRDWVFDDDSFDDSVVWSSLIKRDTNKKSPCEL